MITYELVPASVMPASLKSDEYSVQGTVGALPYWDSCVEAAQLVRGLLELLDNNVNIPGALVLDQDQLIGFIPRKYVYEKLGRPYGVELFLKNSNEQFYKMLGITTLFLPFETSVDDAVKLALMRNGAELYDPIVVSHPDGYRIVSMYTLLAEQQDTLRNLYSEVQTLSVRDPLTMINNRRGFFEIVNAELAAIRQLKLEYAVLMIDIDNFKKINDRYGHLVGDEVIKSVAQQLLARIRDTDVIGRFGGEEFIVFLKDLPQESAFTIAETLRQDIASCFHKINGFQIRVTVSIGMSSSKGTAHTIDKLFSEADEALYFAKNTGRNTVMGWKEDLAQPDKTNGVFQAKKNDPLNGAEYFLDQTVQGLLHMLHLRDYETEAHTTRVSEWTLKLADRIGISKDQYESIRIGSLLHDIGKIGIPDKILFKSGALTKAEWKIMQKHPEYAHDLLSSISYFQHSLEIPYCHHEHWNGKGYPRGLHGEEIPLASRIFTIVDVWDALSSDRPYRAAWKQDEIKEYLLAQSGAMFEPQIVPLFFECLK